MWAGVNIKFVSTAQTRSSYHHGDLRNALLDAAIALAEKDGPAAVTIRAAARLVGVTPTAAYRHFASREDLMADVHRRAFDTLLEAMVFYLDALPETDDPALDALRRVAALGRGYVRFAKTEPGLFRAAFAKASVHDLTEKIAQANSAFGLLFASLDRLVEVGYLSVRSRPLSEVTCWSTVHGISMLLVDGPLSGLPEEVQAQAVDRAIEVLALGMADGPRADPALAGRLPRGLPAG